MKTENNTITPNAWALVPLGVFLIAYLAVSVVAGDFYKMPITVAFVLSSIVAVWTAKTREFGEVTTINCVFIYFPPQHLGKSAGNGAFCKNPPRFLPPCL